MYSQASRNGIRIERRREYMRTKIAFIRCDLYVCVLEQLFKRTNERTAILMPLCEVFGAIFVYLGCIQVHTNTFSQLSMCDRMRFVTELKEIKGREPYTFVFYFIQMQTQMFYKLYSCLLLHPIRAHMLTATSKNLKQGLFYFTKQNTTTTTTTNIIQNDTNRELNYFIVTQLVRDRQVAQRHTTHISNGALHQVEHIIKLHCESCSI